MRRDLAYDDTSESGEANLEDARRQVLASSCVHFCWVSVCMKRITLCLWTTKDGQLEDDVADEKADPESDSEDNLRVAACCLELASWSA